MKKYSSPPLIFKRFQRNWHWNCVDNSLAICQKGGNIQSNGLTQLVCFWYDLFGFIDPTKVIFTTIGFQHGWKHLSREENQYHTRKDTYWSITCIDKFTSIQIIVVWTVSKHGFLYDTNMKVVTPLCLHNVPLIVARSMVLPKGPLINGRPNTADRQYLVK